jgi:hypothetical protein
MAHFQFFKAYDMVCSSDHIDSAVKNLIAIFLKGFDEWFIPADETRSVAYTGKPAVGFRNCYTGVHPYLIVASFLDPWTQDVLGGENKNAKYIMTQAHFDNLKKDVVEHMMVQVHKDTVSEGISGTLVSGE